MARKKQTFKSTVDDIPAKLERLQQVLEKAGYPIDKYLQPGLSREEIDARTRKLPFRLPEELYALYRWRNGTKKGKTLFLSVTRSSPRWRREWPT
jgi:hypothetical protein